MRIRCDHEVLDTDGVTITTYPSINSAKRDCRGTIDQAVNHAQFTAHRRNLLQKHKFIMPVKPVGMRTETSLGWGVSRHMKRVLTPHTPHIPVPKKLKPVPLGVPRVSWLSRKSIGVGKIEAALVNSIANPL